MLQSDDEKGRLIGIGVLQDAKTKLYLVVAEHANGDEVLGAYPTFKQAKAAFPRLFRAALRAGELDAKH